MQPPVAKTWSLSILIRINHSSPKNATEIRIHLPPKSPKSIYLPAIGTSPFHMKIHRWTTCMYMQLCSMSNLLFTLPLQ